MRSSALPWASALNHPQSPTLCSSAGTSNLRYILQWVSSTLNANSCDYASSSTLAHLEYPAQCPGPVSHMICPVYILNKQGDKTHLYVTPLSTGNHSVSPYSVVIKVRTAGPSNAEANNTNNACVHRSRSNTTDFWQAHNQ